MFEETHNLSKVHDAYTENIDKIVASLWSLSDEILFKYASGFVNEPHNMSQMVGYPEWWLEAVGYPDGPPPPPTEPKCCHPPKDGEPSSSTGDGKRSQTTNNYSDFLTGKAAMKQYLRTVSVSDE